MQREKAKVLLRGSTERAYRASKGRIYKDPRRYNLCRKANGAFMGRKEEKIAGEHGSKFPEQSNPNDRVQMGVKQITPNYFTSAMALSYKGNVTQGDIDEIYHKVFRCLDTAANWQFLLFEYEDAEDVHAENIQEAEYIPEAARRNNKKLQNKAAYQTIPPCSFKIIKR